MLKGPSNILRKERNQGVELSGSYRIGEWSVFIRKNTKISMKEALKTLTCIF